MQQPAPLLVSDVSNEDPLFSRRISSPQALCGLCPASADRRGTGQRRVGTVCDRSGARFDTEKLELSQIIANQAAIGVLNANLLEQTLVRTRELETLLEAAQATSYTLDLDEVFSSVKRLALQALDMDDCAIMLWDNVEEALKVEMEFDRDTDEEYTASARDHTTCASIRRSITSLR